MGLSDLKLADYEIPADRLDEIQSPALLIYLDKVRRNIERVVALLAGDTSRWRPHVKTAKIPRVFHELARVGVRHFKCATTRELGELLCVLDEDGIRDAQVLFAFPAVGPALERVTRLAELHPATRISVLCDDPDAPREIRPPLGIHVDVDPGMRRTGLPVGDPSRILGTAAAAGERFEGLHFYEGHVREADPARRRAICFALFDELMRLVARFDRERVAIAEIVTSGTPTFLDALAYPPLRERPDLRHRVSPGTVVYHDARCAIETAELPLEPAAVVLARVVSQPCAGVATCDAGSKAIPPEGHGPCAFVIGHDELRPENSTEEHLTLRVARGDPPPRGSALLLVPYHVCPAINVAREAVLLDGGRIVGLAKVSAGGHEVWVAPPGS